MSKSVYNHHYGRYISTTTGGGGGGSGDVVGPASSTDNSIPRFDGGSGKLIQNTSNFTCDDNANVMIGDSTSDVDRCLHLQSKQDACIFIESDTDNIGETDNVQMVLTQDGGRSHFSLSLDVSNRFKLIAASDPPDRGDPPNHDMVLSVGGITTTAAVGEKDRTFTLPAQDTIVLRASDQHVIFIDAIEADTIIEKTSGSGVTIEGTKMENNAIDMTTSASNPGGANTLWQRNDGKLFRGGVDLEAGGGGDVVGPASATDNAIVRYDGTTGKLIQNSQYALIDDDANIELGRDNFSDRHIHLMSGRSGSLWIESGLDATETLPQVILSARRSEGQLDIGNDNNGFSISSSWKNNFGNQTDITFKTGGVYVFPPPGVKSKSFTTQPIDAMKITRNQNVEINNTLNCDTINEFTTNTGVTIEGTTLENNGIDMTTSSSNPGGANTLWQQTSDGHLFRGAVDLEAGGGGSGDVVGPPSAPDNSLARFNGTTGKIIQTSGTTIDDTGEMSIDNRLRVDTILERSANAGVNLEGVIMRDRAINFQTVASNPGGSNAIWQRTSDGHVFRGSVDLEDTGSGGDVISVDTTSLINSIPRFNTTTGKVIKNSNAYLIDATSSSLRLTTGLLPSSETGLSNTFFGAQNGRFISTGGRNCFFGSNIAVTDSTFGDSSDNVGIGANVFQSASATCNGNVCIGAETAVSLDGGDNNIFVGLRAGRTATTNQNCIYIGQGIFGSAENNVTRIGNNTTATYIAGIYGSMEPPTNSARPLAISSDGQLTKYMMPMAEFSFSDFVTPITLSIPVQNQFYEMALAGLTFTTNKSQKWSTPSAGRLQWDGNYSIYVHTAISLSLQVSTNNEILEIQYRKNGVLLPGGATRNKYGSGGEWSTFAQHLLIQLNPGDYVSMWVTNTTGAGNTLEIGNFNLVGVGH